MHDDVSAIPLGGCNVLSSPTALTNYSGRVRKDFIQNGGVWYLYRTQTSTYGDYDINSYNCIDVSSLNSYAIYQPFLYGLGFLFFIVSLVLVIKTVKGFLYGL